MKRAPVPELLRRGQKSTALVDLHLDIREGPALEHLPAGHVSYPSCREVHLHLVSARYARVGQARRHDRHAR